MRGFALAPALLLVVAACTATGEGLPADPSPLEDREPTTEVADEVRILADKARAAVSSVSNSVRGDLAALRAADDSQVKSMEGLRERLRKMRETSIDHGIGAAEAQVESFLEQLGRLQERSLAIQAAIDDTDARLDSFEEWADDVVRQALTDDTAQSYHREQLINVETEALEQTRNIVLAPRERASDQLAADVGLLGADIEQAGVALQAEVDGRRLQAQALQQQRDEEAASIVIPEPLVPEPLPPSSDEVVEIQTSVGPIVLELFPGVAPRHVENFHKLVAEGFYDGLTVHRVVPGFLAQAGCPLGTGSGGPGYQIKAEFNDRPHRRGTLSMARFAHPDSAGSQFFLCLADLPDLDGKYTAFGRMLRGEDTLAAIEALGTESGHPTEDILMERVVLRERRPDEVSGLADAGTGG